MKATAMTSVWLALGVSMIKRGSRWALMDGPSGGRSPGGRVRCVEGRES